MLGVKLWGGLGNQMFLYAFARFLEKEQNESVSFYTVPFSSEYSGKLQKFRTILNFLTYEDVRKFYFFPPAGFFYRPERKIIQKFPPINRHIYVENTLFYKSSFPVKTILFDGYFQSYKYFEKISEIIRREFKPNIEVEGISGFPPEDITCQNSVSVHFRRGDYLKKNNQKLFARCTNEYYRKAFETINKKIKNPVYHFFSNDPEWIRNNKNHFVGLNYRIIDNSALLDNEIADLLFMSWCSHHIIANSTYSWWAAWLNPDPEKIVIAPAAWYNGKLNETTKDLIPPEWLRM